MMFVTDLHSKSPGQSQFVCELYIDVLRGIIEHQAHLIADLSRRLAREPITQTWIDGVLQEPVDTALDD